MERSGSKHSKTDLTAKFLMVSPAEEIANIIDQPQIANEITSMRLKSTGIEIANEALNAFSTYALLNIVDKPGLYGASVGAEITTTAALYKQKRTFNEKILSAIRNKLVLLTPFIGLINTELIDQGYSEAYHWRLWYMTNQIENKKLGLEKSLTLSRPVLQSISTSKNIPLPLALVGIAASYALIPIFNSFGKDKSKLGDKIGFVGEGRDRAIFYGAKSIKEPLDKLRKKLWGLHERYQYGQIILDRLPQIGFFAASLIAKTDSFGVFRYLQQLYSTPNSYGALKESERDTLRSLGYVKSMHEIMSGKPYFLTSSSWDKYRNKKLEGMQKADQLTSTEPGIKVTNLATLIPDKSMKRFTRSLNVEAKIGEVILLNAESGTGKSVTTGLGLAGLVETQGSFIFTDKSGCSQHLESFPKEEVSKRVWYVAPSHGYDEIRVCDIYQGRAIKKYCDSSDLTQSSLSEMDLLMLSLPDSLLERELYALAKEMKKSEKERVQFYGYDRPEDKKIILDGVEPVFTTKMFDQIYNFRTMRNQMVEELLKKRGSNFKSVLASEPIGHLSTGMKTRFLWELHCELNNGDDRQNETHVVIMDEPFGNLDEQNASEYLELINEITNKPNPPVIILISHTHQDMIRDMLKNKVVEATFS